MSTMLRGSSLRRGQSRERESRFMHIISLSLFVGLFVFVVVNLEDYVSDPC